MVWAPAVTGVSRFVNSARQVAWIHSVGNAAAKRKVRPISRMLDHSVLDRIEMDVIEMAGEIPLVADCVLPTAALPNIAFAATGHNRRSRFDGRQRLGKRDLDRAPAAGEVGVALRQALRQCMWSGSTTQASTRNGARVRTGRTASRSASMRLTSKFERRSSKLTVKEKVPPGTRLRR
jgi:hypothetical protein